MESFVSEELLENTFLYCYKRVSNKESAQDLTQEIVIEALRNVREGRKIENFYAWYWQMAHNKIVRHFQKLQNQALPIDYVETILFASDKTLDQLISSEEIENLNKAISKLAAIHRDIIIRFYLQGQSVKQISKALGLSLGTVTGRLFDARKNLEKRIADMEKKEVCIGDEKAEHGELAGARVGSQADGKRKRKISKLSFDYKNSAFLNWYALDSLLAQQIVIACRLEKKTENEIADEIDAVPVYIEDRIKELKNRGIITEASEGNYLANMFVFPTSALKKVYECQKAVMKKIDFELRFFELLISMKDDILKLDFYGKHFDYRFLLWYFSIRGGKEFAELCLKAFIKQNKIELGDYKPNNPLMGQFDDFEGGDSGAGGESVNYQDKISWSYCFPDFWTPRVGYAQCQVTIEQPPFSREVAGWWGKNYEPGRMGWVNRSNGELLIDLMENPKKTLNQTEEELAAECIKNGVLNKNADGGLELNIPVSPLKFQDDFCALFDKTFESLAEEYTAQYGPLIKNALDSHIHKGLKKDFYARTIQWLFQPLVAVYEYGLKNKIYQIPEDYSHSTAGMWIYRKID